LKPIEGVPVRCSAFNRPAEGGEIGNRQFWIKEIIVPRKMSDRWLAANKENAQNSTGPKTQKGMARSAQNACKHGILSKEVVVNDGDGRESAAEFVELVERLHAQFQPQDAVEQILVDRVAACYWRLRRAQRFEVGAVREGLDNCKTPPDGPGPNLLEYDVSVRKLNLMHDIKRHLHPKPVKEHQSSAIRSKGEVLTAPTDQLDHQAGDGSDLVKEAAAKEAEDRAAKMEEAIREDKARTDRAERQDALIESRRPYLAALPADEPLNRLIRYETMLDRQLHRALSELRRRRALNNAEPFGHPGGQQHAETPADEKPD